MSTTPPAATADTFQPQLTKLVIAGWGLGSFAASTMFQATSVYLLQFLTDYVGLAAALAGAILIIVKLYDAVLDPFVGGLSDRTQSRFGRRRPFIAIGGLLCAVSFVLMFNLPKADNETMRATLAVLVLLLNSTGYAVISIPYLAMPAEMTRDPGQRTVIVSYRVVGIALGQIVGSTVAAWLINAGGGGKQGFSIMAWTLGGIILVFALACFQLTAKAPAFPLKPEPKLSMGEKVKTALANKPFAVLILMKIFGLVSLNFYFAVLPFLFKQVLQIGYKDLGLYFLVQGPCIILSQPLWVAVAKRVGKRGTFWISSAIHAIAVASWVLSGPGQPIVWFILRAVAIGVSSGGLLLSGQAMLPDAIAEDFRRTGQRREGLFAGVYTTTEKLAQAVSFFLIGTALSALGYASAKGGAAQAAGVSDGIKWLLLIPAICDLFASLALILYRIPPDPTAADIDAAKTVALADDEF